MKATFTSTMIWTTSGLRFQRKMRLGFEKGKIGANAVNFFYFHPSLMLPNGVMSLHHMTWVLVPAICHGHRRIAQTLVFCFKVTGTVELPKH